MERHSFGKMNRSKLAVRSILLFAILAIIAVGLAVSPYPLKPQQVEAATSFASGDTITADVTLTADVDCTGYDASLSLGRVLTIGADGITIDGAGFTLGYTGATEVWAGIYADNFDNVTITNLTIVGAGSESHATVFLTPDLTVGGATLLNNDFSNGQVKIDGVKNATIDANVITPTAAWPASALVIDNVPGGSTYSITGNTLINLNGGGLIIGKVQNPGITLTLESNIFDGSRWGAILNNIDGGVGGFSLSHTNSFVGAGWTGGYPVFLSGMNLTVDGWSTLGTVGAGADRAIYVGQRQLFGHFTVVPSEDIFITNNTVTVLGNGTKHGIVLDGVKSATITGNTVTPTGSWPDGALEIINVPASSTYDISNNTLINPNGGGLIIGKVQNPGITLTLESNIFDGSRWGAILNNIDGGVGGFTLSTTNTFDGAGHTGGTPLTISGPDG